MKGGGWGARTRPGWGELLISSGDMIFIRLKYLFRALNERIYIFVVRVDDMACIACVSYMQLVHYRAKSPMIERICGLDSYIVSWYPPIFLPFSCYMQP